VHSLDLQDSVTDEEAGTQDPGYVPGRRRPQQHQEQAQQRIDIDPHYEEIEDQFLSRVRAPSNVPGIKNCALRG